jgi:type II restriction/modification system DNA methylase subunit YeeA
VAFFFKSFYASRLEDGYLYKKVNLAQLPLPPITKENQHIADQITQKVDEILAITQSADYETNQEKHRRVKVIEREIDELVYKLYGLNDDEIKMIEKVCGA